MVTPDTILRWHRKLIARKWTADRQRGYRRIQGALKNLGHRVAQSTVATILQAHGIGPVPERPMSWRRFLSARVRTVPSIAAPVWGGLVCYYYRAA